MLAHVPFLHAGPMKRIDWPGAEAGGLTLTVACSQADLEALQRLRFRVFTEDMGAVFPQAVGDRDVDHFDSWCVHFMVRDTGTGRVVGTYRLLTPEAALQAGGYYSESEFDLGPLAALRPLLVEVGRSCIDAEFRHGTAIMLLWSGLAQVMRQGGYRYMLGCASVSLRDGGATASEVWRRACALMERNPDVPRIRPLHPYPVDRLDSVLPARVPPLIKGYLALGATICGAPAWDPDFHTADFPILLDLDRLDARYRRHFGID
ncbi:GNAT family N-acetyltransferase [Castellaniella daejeonensis]|jgi:putative hemolysin|uniref:L-ornithine N(alpha)-acyltransferase n=1 Tax=Castellaniella daejeonensis TaxID=659013 RepID=A0ABN0TZW0_9BURK